MGLGSLFKKKKPVDLGEPIVVVSGLPRSGTSMAMKMLEAAGLKPIQDSHREADVDNPKGYYEDARVKDLHENLDKSWLREARGKVIKIISYLLKELPESNHYRVVFMRRHLDEVLASQNKMLKNRGEENPATDEEMRKTYQDHLDEVFAMIRQHKTFECLEVDYRKMVEQPLEQARAISEFIGGGHNVEKMASVVDKSLYRNRAN